jgi:predicted metal-dependent hydrolase
MKQEEPDDEIMLWGNKFELEISHGRFNYQISDDNISVTSTKVDINLIKKRIYLNEIEKSLKTLNDEINQTILKKGIKPLPFKFKYLKSKFGSYHRKNKEITLNTFLARLDPVYLKYVIYHEYAHAIVFNHSKDFYNLLGEFMPNHRLYQKDLKRIAII